MSHVIPKGQTKQYSSAALVFRDHNVSELGIELQALHHGFKAETEPIVSTPAKRADADSTAIDCCGVHSSVSDEDRLRGQNNGGVCQTAASSPAEMEARVS